MKRPTSLHLLALLLSGLLITGCELLLGDDPSLTDTRWELQAIEIENTSGEMIFNPDSDESYWVRFHADSTVTAKNACNDCNGRYEANGSALSIGAHCTQIGCGTLDYLYVLCNATSYAITGDELRLHSTDRQGNEQILVHRPD